MKTLVINGSPKKNGTISILLKNIVSGIPQQENIEWVNVYDLNIKPCVGCMKCRQDGKCCLPKDDGHTIGEKIKNADNLIIGTPTYWGDMSSQLKVLLERNVPVFIGKNKRGLPIPMQKGKKAIIATSCTTPYPFNFILPESRGAINSVKKVLKYGGYKITGTITKPGSKSNPKLKPGILKKAQKSGSKLLQKKK